MKPILIAACVALAMTGSAAAQQAFNPDAITRLRAEARLPGEPQRAVFDGGFVLDAGAAIASDHDNLTLTHVPAGSDWMLEIPTVVTMEGTQSVRVSCDVSSFPNIDFGSRRPVILLGATEHTFATGGPFLGQIVLGVSAIAADPEASGAAMVRCALSASGVRNGIAWRSFEYVTPYDARAPVQYVLESDDSRLWTGAPFNSQVVLSALGGIALRQERHRLVSFKNQAAPR